MIFPLERIISRAADSRSYTLTAFRQHLNSRLVNVFTPQNGTPQESSKHSHGRYGANHCRNGGLLLAVVILAFLVRLACFQGFHNSDDATYAALAHGWNNGTFVIGKPVPVANAFPLRLGLILPVALGLRLLGPGLVSLTIVPFILSLAQIAVVFAVCLAWFSRRTAVFAALFLALVPLDVRLASSLYPDMPASFFCTIGTILLITGGLAFRGRVSIVLGICSGATFGLSWMIKESLIYHMPVMLVLSAALFAIKRTSWRTLVASGVTLAVCVIGEAIFYATVSGRPFFRFEESAENFRKASLWFFSEGGIYGWKPGHYWSALATRLFISGPKDLLFNDGYALWPLMALVCVLLPPYKKRSIHLILVQIWFVVSLLVFNFGTTSLKFYQPLVLMDRYYYPILLPAILVVMGMFHQWTNCNHLRIECRISYLVILLFFAITLTKMYQENSRMAKWGQQTKTEKQLSRIVRPDDTLFCDPRTQLALNFYWGYPSRTNTFDTALFKESEIPPGSFVFVNNKLLDQEQQVYGTQKPSYSADTPPNWELQNSGNGWKLFRIQGESQVLRSREKPVAIVQGMAFLPTTKGYVPKESTSGTQVLQDYVMLFADVKLTTFSLGVEMNFSSDPNSPSNPCPDVLLYRLTGNYKEWRLLNPTPVVGHKVFRAGVRLPAGDYRIRLQYFRSKPADKKPRLDVIRFSFL